MDGDLHQLFTEVEVLKAKIIEREKELSSLAQALKEHMISEIAERKEANLRLLQLEKKQSLWSGAILVVVFLSSFFDLPRILSGGG